MVGLGYEKNEGMTINIITNCTAYARDGRECSIPFIYKGVTYHQCTDVDNPPGKHWCSLTPNYDEDPQWVRCAGVMCDGKFL